MTLPTIDKLLNANPNNGPDPDLNDQDEREDDEEQGYEGAEQSLGWLDEEEWPDEKLAKYLIKEWELRNDEMRPRLLKWYVNRLRRAGDRWVGIRKAQDRNEYRIYTPPGGAKAPPTLGKGARLCRRLTSQMFQDPPTPEAVPFSDADDDRASAEFASRLLQSLSGEQGVNTVRLARRAFSQSHTYGSAFRYWWVNPYGGGRAPKRMMAHPQAQHADQALEIVDPATGMSTPAEPASLTMRMVAPDGTFTDDETAADVMWQPRLCGEVHTGAQVRFYPVTASAIDTAEYAILLRWTTLGELKLLYREEIEELDDETIKKAVAWYPQGVDLKYLLPDHLTEEDLQRSREQEHGEYRDGALLCTMLVYRKACYDHEQGAAITVLGPKTILARHPWVVERDGKRLELDLPFDQMKGYDEGENDPYGKGTMDFLGPGDELLASVDSAWITHFERFSNRKVFVPITSALQAKVAQAGTGTYVPINPGGQPIVEDVPQFPADSIELRNKIVENLDDESGLQLTAQGVDSPYVQSGFHAVQVIEQVLAGLSELRQNTADALERGWRLQLQLIKAFYTIPQQSKFLGPDQEYKLEYWMASDLGSTTDVRVLRGTFSMMTPAMKSSIAVSMNQAGVLSPYELRRFTIGATGGLIGVQDDPHWLRVNRQIAAWQKGEEANGGMNPFEPIAADQQQPIAQMRLEELGRTMAGTTYQKSSQAWRAVLDQAYQMAMMAAFPPPMPDPNAQADPNAASAAPPPAVDPAAGPMPVGADPTMDPTMAMDGMLPVDNGGLPPDAGVQAPPPMDAPFPETGVPELDGVALPTPMVKQPQIPFAEL
jgi:hypothetical protein